MKIIDKYRKLRDDQFVTDMMAKSVYGTMQLDHQTVPMKDVRKIVQHARAKNIENSETA